MSIIKTLIATLGLLATSGLTILAAPPATANHTPTTSQRLMWKSSSLLWGQLLATSTPLAATSMSRVALTL